MDEAENSPCLALHPTQWCCQLMLPSINSQMLLEKRGCQFQVWILRICPTVNFPIWTLCLRDLTLDSCHCPSLELPQWRVHRLSTPLFLLASEWFRLVADDYPRNLAFETTATGISFELIVLFWTRSFTVTATELGPKSRVQWLPSLKSEKIMISCKLTISWLNWLVDSRLKLNKMRM